MYPAPSNIPCHAHPFPCTRALLLPGAVGPEQTVRSAPPPPAQAPRIRMTDKPFAPACERHRDPILAVLRAHFAGSRHVLEVGSGTGQHAVHFPAAMPLLRWQCSDQAEHLPGLRTWLAAAARGPTPLPPALVVTCEAWPPAARKSA